MHIGGISSIIITYNNENHIQSCLVSLTNALRQTKAKFEIIVHDNASKDQTVKIASRNLYDICSQVICSKSNLGFAKAVNKSITRAKYNNILLINPDVILDSNTIIELVYALVNNGGNCILGGRSTNDKFDFEGSCFRKPNVLSLIFEFTNLRRAIPFDYYHKFLYYSDIKDRLDTIPVDCVTGAVMLFNKYIYQTVGIFDEKFFLYLEDVDFCLRSRKLGFPVLYCATARYYHHWGGSSKNKHRILYHAWENSRIAFINKYTNEPVKTALKLVYGIDRKLNSLRQR